MIYKGCLVFKISRQIKVIVFIYKLYKRLIFKVGIHKINYKSSLYYQSMFFKYIFGRHFLSLIIIVLTGQLAHAANIIHIADYKYWSVFKTDQNVKYAVSFPIKDEGTYTKRERPYIMISNFKGKIEISINVGYHQKKMSKAEATIFLDRNVNPKKENFYLATSREFCWNDKDEDDQRMINFMKRGDKVVIKAQSTRNTNSIDTYSLDGFTGAYNEITKK